MENTKILSCTFHIKDHHFQDEIVTKSSKIGMRFLVVSWMILIAVCDLYAKMTVLGHEY